MSSPKPPAFEDLWLNTKDSFEGQNLYLHLSGFALTPLIIMSGLDAEVNDTFDNRRRNDIFSVGVTAGYLAPALLGVPLYINGRTKEDPETLRASYAVLQSTIITVSYISLLKGFTGRPPPNNSAERSIQEQSEEFNFGLFERGIFWGWPSGHMGTTMALASTLTHYYPDTDWIKWAGYGTSAYMFVLVSAHDKGQMHWFSDAVAGGLMGYAIGSTVGSNFRSKQLKPESRDMVFLPILDREKSGVQIVWKY
ncbi:MAG: phosphatase PAP2 family protein [Bacteriovoracia bacterium]